MSAGLGKQLLEVLQSDLRTLSSEAKKKHPLVKDAAERGILRLRTIAALPSTTPFNEAMAENDDVLTPFLMACESKQPKLVQVAVGCIQKIISHNAVPRASLVPVVDMLWMLMEEDLEEVKILQCCLSLITSSLLLHDESLSKVIVLCFRLYFKKDVLTNNTAAATLRQVVTVVFDRVIAEDKNPDLTKHLQPTSPAAVGTGQDSENDQSGLAKARRYPKILSPCASDAYLLFHDLCRLTNGDAPYWLVGIVEMSRTFGLELIESCLSNHPDLFLNHAELSFLLKEKVCPLVIKLFSSGMKYHNNAAPDKASFPVSTRLLKIVMILIQHFYTLLVTESEIFLSMLTKFLDPDKPMWQRAVAVEVMRGLCMHPDMLMSICEHYDMQPQSTKVFRNMIASISGFITSLFSAHTSGSADGGNSSPSVMTSSSNNILTSNAGGNAATGSNAGGSGGAGSNSAAGSSSYTVGGVVVGPLRPILPESMKNLCLETVDKADAPIVTESYSLTIAFSCLMTLVESLSAIVTTNMSDIRIVSEVMWTPSMAGMPSPPRSNAAASSSSSAQPEQSSPGDGSDMYLRDTKRTMKEIRQDPRFAIWREMVESSYGSILQGVAQLLQNSKDDDSTQVILKSYQTYTNLCGVLDMRVARDAFLSSLCKFCLPANYDPRGEPPALHGHLTVGGGVGSLSLASIAGGSSLGGGGGSGGGGSGGGNSGGSGGSSSGGSGGSGAGGSGGNALGNLGGNNPVIVSANGGWALTSNNIAAFRALLYIIHCLGDILGDAWHIAMETLMHLDSIVGGSEASLALLSSSSRRISDNRLNIGSAISLSGVPHSELSVLASMLSGLFDSSKYLDDDAVEHLVKALCRLGRDSNSSFGFYGSSTKSSSLSLSSYNLGGAGGGASGNSSTSSPAAAAAKIHRHANAFVTCRMWEMGSVNLHRVHTFWPAMESYLIEEADSADVVVREYAVDALTRLAHAALSYDKHSVPLMENQVLQETVFISLQQLSTFSNADVRVKQLECLLQILHSCGQSLSRGWPIALSIATSATRQPEVEDSYSSTASINGGGSGSSNGNGNGNSASGNGGAAATNAPGGSNPPTPQPMPSASSFVNSIVSSTLASSVSVNLVRLGFQSVQLIIADFLSSLPVECLVLCIDTVGKFGLQQVDMNISLTAVGLLWSIADFLHQEKQSVASRLEKLAGELKSASDGDKDGDKDGGSKGGSGGQVDPQSAVTALSGVSTMDGLWMALFSRLASICIDSRPEVRKSASQTLFSTISTHGSLLAKTTWHACLWEIIFPLLRQVQIVSDAASEGQLQMATQPASIMVHHSRNTASKQWDETKVIALTGAAQVFSNYSHYLAAFDDFPRAWTALLEIIEHFAIDGSKEVAVAAIESLQEILKSNESEPTESPVDPANAMPSHVWRGLFLKAWATWLNIGSAVTDLSAKSSSSSSSNGSSSNASTDLCPQNFLQAFVDTFPHVYAKLGSMFSISDARQLFDVLRKVMLYPNTNAYRDAENTTSLQNSLLGVFTQITPSNPDLWPIMILELLDYIPMAWSGVLQQFQSGSLTVAGPSSVAALNAAAAYYQSIRQTPASVSGVAPSNFTPLARRCLALVSEMYEAHADSSSVLQQSIFSRIVQVLRTPLALKYACPSQSLWRLSVNCLIATVRKGLRLQKPSLLGEEAVTATWNALIVVIEEFLFSDSTLPKDYTMEQMEIDQDVDVSIVELIKSDIFPFTDNVKQATVSKLMDVLRKGSEPSVVANGAPMPTSSALAVPRERFAKLCFDTLLMTSFTEKPGQGISEVALSALLERCRAVLQKYVASESTSGSLPLPRAQIGEVMFVLKAIVSLVASLQTDSAGRKRVDERERKLLVEIYPVLVECIVGQDLQVRTLLRDVLQRVGQALF